MAAAKKIAIVTGGGTGIGRGVANRLVADGYHVAIVGRRPDRLKSKRGEKNLHPYICDVAKHADIQRTVKSVLAEFGRIDVLVNNAGVVRRQFAASITQEALHYTIGINLIGTINFCVACIPALKKSQGAIVNISSSLSDRCYAEYAVYAASKGGMNSFSKTLAVELAPQGIRVNVVSPSLVRSEIYLPDGMSQREYDKHLAEVGKSYFPIGRAGEPEDVAAAVAFLASPEASWITGIVMMVDGGEAAGLKHAGG
ncbi:MAG: SDR family oxidoreductase [Alphaproteobacteria bacterium]|nr:SDR family oxidoreductase [Alphaproteobacteria bacterium]